MYEIKKSLWYEGSLKCLGNVSDERHIDVLINNAGLMGGPKQLTEDGFEMQLGVNHLGWSVLSYLYVLKTLIAILFPLLS